VAGIYGLTPVELAGITNANFARFCSREAGP